MNFLRKAFHSNQDGPSHDSSSGARSAVMTKEELRQSNIRMSGEVAHLQPKIDIMTQLLVKLQRDYNLSKSHDPLSRYNVLKDMIKTFLDDWERNSLIGSKDNRGAVGLVQRAKLMAKTQEKVADHKEKYRSYSHAELIDEYDSLKKEINRLKTFEEKAPSIVAHLDEEYETSKQFDAMRRYKILKDLIKEVIALVDSS